MNERHSVISVFGSARAVDGDADYEAARILGTTLAEAGFTVCNGGYGGTMEASARGAKEAGGKTIGVICRKFGATANRYIDESILKETLQERLETLIALGSAYVVLRGGTGTLLELAAVWEYMNKRLITPKPIIVVGSFWYPVVSSMKDELIAKEGARGADLVHEVASPDDCIRLVTTLLGSPRRDSADPLRRSGPDNAL